ncbi:MAG: OsmC family protein [Thiotrichaceae bacterium]|nr:OsmC family protein [Thiotrichaceae bacterium]
MNVHLVNQTEVLLSNMHEDGFEQSQENEALYYGAIAMWVTSLGRCTFAVLDHYALRLELEPDDITVTLQWEFDHDPTTIKQIDMHIQWPELPENRLKAVQRASHKCTIHNTIKDCVKIVVTVGN